MGSNTWVTEEEISGVEAPTTVVTPPETTTVTAGSVKTGGAPADKTTVVTVGDTLGVLTSVLKSLSDDELARVVALTPEQILTALQEGQRQRNLAAQGTPTRPGNYA